MPDYPLEHLEPPETESYLVKTIGALLTAFCLLTCFAGISLLGWQTIDYFFTESWHSVPLSSIPGVPAQAPGSLADFFLSMELAWILPATGYLVAILCYLPGYHPPLEYALYIPLKLLMAACLVATVAIPAYQGYLFLQTDQWHPWSLLKALEYTGVATPGALDAWPGLVSLLTWVPLAAIVLLLAILCDRFAELFR